MQASFSSQESASRGRRYPEAEHPYRGPWQRDRDRILHASAFRRLTAKTQVLVWGTNDHHRTRLTHTLEVAQVSRTIARQLGLHEDLTEAIALAHDLGHPPFGHAGEAALDECMKPLGGYEHNWQGLRIVEELEQRYLGFPGLNLTWEVRESLAFHSKRPEVAEVAFYRAGHQQPSLEAQVVDAADSIVYDVHDLEDAFGVKLITLEQVRSLHFWKEVETELIKQHGNISESRLIPTVLRYLLAWRERAMLETTKSRLADIKTVDEVRAYPEPLVSEGTSLEPVIRELRQFLHQHVYHHPQVLQMASRGKRIVRALYEAYTQQPSLMPEVHAMRAKVVARAVGDYVAGMTDRLAAIEYATLFQSTQKSDKIETST